MSQINHNIELPFCLLILAFTFFSSCSNKVSYAEKGESLPIVSSFEIKGLKVTDEKLFEVLDSVIVEVTSCKYFEKRVPYSSACLITWKESNHEVTYRITAPKSIEIATGLFSNRAEGKDYPKDVGGFYYKNFLFIAHTDSSNEKFEIRYPFLKHTNCSIRIQDIPLKDKRVFSSSIQFKYKKGLYEITYNDLCTPPILIER